MDIHNTNEDIVHNTVQTIFEEIKRTGNQEGFCLCYQCRMDTVCYALNRTEPNYIVSNRGLTRAEQADINRQQIIADVTSLVYKGLRLVNHNMRPTAPHDGTGTQHSIKTHHPLFDIPTIAGRLFNGASFEPIVNIKLALYCDGELVSMRNTNWQNPFDMVSSTPGAFSFWPAPVIADVPEIEKVFKYSLKVDSPDFEPFSHFFNITAVSKYHTPHSYTMNRTYKLPDLYLFPPGEVEQSW
jgi:competence protein ComFB